MPALGRVVVGLCVVSLAGAGCGKAADRAAADGALAQAPKEQGVANDADTAAAAETAAPEAAASAAPAADDQGKTMPAEPGLHGGRPRAAPSRLKSGTAFRMGGKADLEPANPYASGEKSTPVPAAPPVPVPGDGKAAIAPVPVRQALAPIDPNGRFATTYRPGAGHLAAFESAVARGIVPASERELVSDVGARYAADFAAPKGQAIGVHADLERDKLTPNGGPFHLRVSLRSTDEKPAARPHLSVHLVLDISGSMNGESITHARQAAEALVDKLAATDDFSFTTFSNEATLRVPDGPVGARRASIKRTIEDVRAIGGTNIGAGLSMGYAQADEKSIPADAVKVVLLLSDGRANIGITQQAQLSKLALDAFQKGVQTSSFGLGPDYDGALMSAIASEGAGGYYYLRDAAQIAPALATEIDKRLDPVATAVEVRVRLKKGVELLHVYGSERLSDAAAAHVRAQEVAADEQAKKRDKIAADRQDDLEGGMRFFMPAFAKGDAHAFLFQLKAPPGAGKLGLGIVEVRYKDRVAKKNMSDEIPLAVAYADSDSASGATLNPSVARTVQGFAAGETLTDAARRIGLGDRKGALAELVERETILRKAADTLNEPLFKRDADRLARLEKYAGNEGGLGEPLVLAMMLETAGHAHLR
jgi:Ca-activated chloride channel family protein